MEYKSYFVSNVLDFSGLSTAQCYLRTIEHKNFHAKTNKIYIYKNSVFIAPEAHTPIIYICMTIQPEDKAVVYLINWYD